MSQDNQISELKAFPEAKSGMQRLVIALPHKTRDESYRYKVELIPGKTMRTDGVNHYRSGLQIKAKPLQGWGYTYYEIVGEAAAMTTLIGVPEGTPEVIKFVQGKSITIDYNSRIPVVIYAPTGNEIKYRIWRTEDTLIDVKPG